jgi:hypothetical protein
VSFCFTGVYLGRPFKAASNRSAPADGGQGGSAMIPRGGTTCPPAPESIQVKAHIYAWTGGCGAAARGEVVYQNHDGEEAPSSRSIWWRRNWSEIWGFGWSTCGVKGFPFYFEGEPAVGWKVS